MEIYKYCKRDHMEAFFDTGLLQIGTLMGYRDVAKHGSMVGDHNEGRHSFIWQSSNANANAKTVMDEILFLRGQLSKDLWSLAGTLTVTGERDTPNFYVFSTSLTYDRATHENWLANPEAEYDACYRINAPYPFFRAISRRMEERATLCYQGRVHYYADRVDLRSRSGQLLPAAHKAGVTHGPQCEYRALWMPIGAGDIEAFRISVPVAVKYCVRHVVL